MSNPYKNLPDFCYWSKVMSAPAPGLIDPVVKAKIITPEQKVATMGSCFAQHLAKHISKSGLNYYISEPAPENLDPQIALQRNYGVFSARFGNVYTVKQALQLFDRAFGTFVPEDSVWKRGGIFVDAFRPTIEPDGFRDIEALENDRVNHFNCIRDMFVKSDWLVFTLGLTEGWRSRIDGAVYPIAPGVAGGVFDSLKYDFVNFTINEVIEDLTVLITKIRALDCNKKILLTVSPVPLIATYEARHVLVSTTYSKSVLRVAADEIERKFQDVIYFPSYEIITSPATGGRYYLDDLRQVTELGVNHVMRVFGKHFFDKVLDSNRTKNECASALSFSNNPCVVCDEEEIIRALKLSGF